MGKKKAAKAGSGASKGQVENSKHNDHVDAASSAPTSKKGDDESQRRSVSNSLPKKKRRPSSRLHVLKQAFWQLLVPLIIGFIVAYFVKSMYENVRRWIRGADIDTSMVSGEIRSQLLGVEVLQHVDVSLKQASWG